MKLRHYIVTLIIIPLLLLFWFVAKIGEERPGFFRVIRIIDGDTVELTGGERLRLLGIDTPEYGEPYYDSAKLFLAGMILGREVRVDFGPRRRDNYGRMLGFIYKDTILVNTEILRCGYGWVYLFPEERQDDLKIASLLAVQRMAMADTSGIWRLPVYMEEEHYIGNRRSMRFHRPDCPSVQTMSEGNKVRFLTREAAMYEGYAPCRNCRP